MGGAPEYATNGTRIGKDGVSSITWNEACDVSVTGWLETEQAIISVDCTSSTHTPPSASLQLRWRVSGGSFAALTNSGALQGGASAGAINNTDPVGDPQNCPSDVIDASEECENENPLQSASLSASQDDQIETQWCIDMSNAVYDAVYEFELFNTTETESCGQCIPTITIRSDPEGPTAIADKKTIGKGIMEGVLN